MKNQHKKVLDVNLDDFPVEIVDQVIKLADDDGVIREHAREKLVKYGDDVVPYIHMITKTDDVQLRWEASKILEQIGDDRSIPILTDLLLDEDSEIRWIAAEGLITIGRASIVPLLIQVKHHDDSIYMHEGAHHVLREVLDKHERERFTDLLNALDNKGVTSERIPIEADKALKYFR